MLTSLFHAGTFHLESVAIALGTAIVLGLLIAGIYRAVSSFAGGFAVVLALLPFLVASVIMIVNGNLGTSVAVLGAFGLVRFRSAPGSAREIGFIFFAMAVGLASGMGFITLAALIAAVGCVLIFLLFRLGFERNLSEERTLRVTIPEDLSYNGIFDDLFQQYTRRHELQRVKTTNMGTMYELTYRVIMRNPSEEKPFLDAVRCRNGNLTISLGLVERERNEL
ncbi:MAG: DUF4956 domain-containing protein [Eubacterium sp.]|nr:DUF4956 domain-containing protein [Eubacterium sp.]